MKSEYRGARIGQVSMRALLACVLGMCAGSLHVRGRQAADAKVSGTVLRVLVHGAALEGNLEGDSPDRNVSIYLPPSYSSAKERHYPVIYFLHGFLDSDVRWFDDPKHFINLPTVISEALANGSAREMIVVMPDAYTRYEGSFYSSSVTTGDWEDFVAHDLVRYMDTHYRTIPRVESRGLAGHSMGGYGTIRIGIEHPEVFSSVYALSACCLVPMDVKPTAEQLQRLAAITTPDEVHKQPFGVKAVFAEAAAWAPDPKNPPFFLDLPYVNLQAHPFVPAKFAANYPIAMLDQYIPNIRRLHAIAFDVGTQDMLLDGSRALDAALEKYGIPHSFETYEGNHLNHIADRVRTKTLPFFSANLSFDQGH